MDQTAPNKRSTLIATGIMSFLFCAGYNMARHFDLITGDVAGFRALDALVIPAALVLWFVVYKIFGFIDARFVLRDPAKPFSRRQTIATFVGLIAVWGLYLCVFCPGFIYFDTMNSWWQFNGMVEYSNYHPVLYTALVGWLAKIPIPNSMPWTFMFWWLGVLQVVVLAIECTWVLHWLAKRGAPKWLFVFSYLYLMLNPVVPLFVILLTSDALFSGFVLISIPMIYDLVHKPLREVTMRDLAPLLAVSVAICFSRNNGIYVMLFTLFVLFFWFKKGRRWVVTAGASLMVFWMLVINVFYPAAGIAEVPFAEAVGIPLQQIGCTLHENGDVNEEEREFLKNVLTTPELMRRWNPATADAIKYDDKFGDDFLNAHKVEFIQTWFSILQRNPATYVKAYLMETIGWWDVGVYRWVRIGAGGWVWTPEYNIIDIDLVERATGIPARQIGDIVLCENNVEWIPFANAGCHIWIMALAIVFLLRGRREYRKNAIALAPLVGIWITLMIASPIFCEFRYVFALCLSWPPMLFFLCHKDDSATNTE